MPVKTLSLKSKRFRSRNRSPFDLLGQRAGVAGGDADLRVGLDADEAAFVGVVLGLGNVCGSGKSHQLDAVARMRGTAKNSLPTAWPAFWVVLPPPEEL